MVLKHNMLDIMFLEVNFLHLTLFNLGRALQVFTELTGACS